MGRGGVILTWSWIRRQGDRLGLIDNQISGPLG